jgi:hypothetical protein
MIVSIALLAAGCGVGEYKQRMRSGIANMSQSSVYAGLKDPQSIGGTPVTIQLPKSLTLTALPEGADNERRSPLGIDVPGLVETYEGTVADSEGGQYPYYVYLYAIESDSVPGRQDDLTDLFQSALNGKLDKQFTFEATSLTTPQGKGLAAELLRVESPQTFRYVNAQGNPQPTEMDGILEIYHAKTGGWVAAIGWRVPASIAGNVGLQKWAPLVAGTLKLPADGGGGGGQEEGP